jgi:hypothetical protein
VVVYWDCDVGKASGSGVRLLFLAVSGKAVMGCFGAAAKEAELRSGGLGVCGGSTGVLTGFASSDAEGPQN